METILHLLPLTGAQKAAFQALCLSNALDISLDSS